MANYIALLAGKLKEVAGLVVSAGAADAGKIVALDASGRLDNSVLPTGIGQETAVVQASENLSAGDFVNIWNDAGDTRVRKADGSNSAMRAHGFVLAAVTSGNNATIYFYGINNQLSGLTPGTDYYLASTAGDVDSTPPNTNGAIVQLVGVAHSATEIYFEPDGLVVEVTV